MYIEQGNQIDLPSAQPEAYHEIDTDHTRQEIVDDQETIEQNDKAAETEIPFNIETDDKNTLQNTEEIPTESRLNMGDQIVPLDDPPIDQNDDDTKSILSSTKSDTSPHEQLRRLRYRFQRLSKERRLLSCLLILYLMIMCGLLVVICILLWSFQGRSVVYYQDVTITEASVADGVARYGESCQNDTDCKRPFICYKKRLPSTSGICRCPLNYDFAGNQCIGDLNALCTKDTDCQRHMLCSGVNDGTRRCLCQASYNYDLERRQCRGDYHTACQSDIDCRTNLICNTTATIPLCSCPVNYRYDLLVHKCRGDPSAICEQTTAECAPNAECRDGVCECAFQFVPDKTKKCVDPCPRIPPNPVRIRYPGNCRRFIDCQQRSKSECPEMTIFNFRTQLCDYPQNVLDCR